MTLSSINFYTWSLQNIDTSKYEHSVRAYMNNNVRCYINLARSVCVCMCREIIAVRKRFMCGISVDNLRPSSIPFVIYESEIVMSEPVSLPSVINNISGVSASARQLFKASYYETCTYEYITHIWESERARTHMYVIKV